MNKTIFVLLFCFLHYFQAAYSQKSKVSPFQLKVENFEDTKKIVNNETYVDEGITYKIINTDYEKGVKIVENNGKEQWHGIVYRFSSGKLNNMTTYEFGKKNGIYEAYALSSGKVIFRKQYVNDLLEGMEYQYAGEGDYLYCETVYSAGEKNGKQTYYHRPENGESRGPVSTVNIYQNGRMVESTTYQRDGKVFSHKKY